eukprot:m51a1_g4569 hypothetical protein (191) ;mRNA; f:137973-138545
MHCSANASAPSTPTADTDETSPMARSDPPAGDRPARPAPGDAERLTSSALAHIDADPRAGSALHLCAAGLRDALAASPDFLPALCALWAVVEWRPDLIVDDWERVRTGSVARQVRAAPEGAKDRAEAFFRSEGAGVGMALALGAYRALAGERRKAELELTKAINMQCPGAMFVTARVQAPATGWKAPDWS